MEKQNRMEMADINYPYAPSYPGGASTSETPHHPYGNPPPYAESQPGYAYNQPTPGMTGSRTTVITTSPAIVMINNLGPNPTSCFCTMCNKQVVTVAEKTTTGRTHLIAAILCLLGCWCCVCIPYCVDSCKKTFHYCPQCKTYMGSNS